jgi:hypothetical protein
VEDYASPLFIDSTQTSFRTEVVLAESANDWTARFRGGCGTLTYSCVPVAYADSPYGASSISKGRKRSPSREAGELSNELD